MFWRTKIYWACTCRQFYPFIITATSDYCLHRLIFYPLADHDGDNIRKIVADWSDENVRTASHSLGYGITYDRNNLYILAALYQATHTRRQWDPDFFHNFGKHITIIECCSSKSFVKSLITFSTFGYLAYKCCDSDLLFRKLAKVTPKMSDLSLKPEEVIIASENMTYLMECGSLRETIRNTESYTLCHRRVTNFIQTFSH